MILSQVPIEVISTSEVHDQMEQGRFFSGGNYNSSIAVSSNLDILIITPASHTATIYFSGNASQDITIILYEGATYSATGSAITLSNHNRQSALVTDMLAYYGPTITTTGAQINSTQYIPSGAGGGASGGGSAAFDGFQGKFILKNSTTYLLRTTNVGSTNAKIQVEVGFYQETLT